MKHCSLLSSQENPFVDSAYDADLLVGLRINHVALGAPSENIVIPFDGAVPLRDYVFHGGVCLLYIGEVKTCFISAPLHTITYI